jgi:hypothetical protein
VRDSRFLTPHQFRTRNDPIKRQRPRSNAKDKAAKSTNLIDILPLIPVWLQVAVLLGQPQNQALPKFSLVAAGSPHQMNTAFFRASDRAEHSYRRRWTKNRDGRGHSCFRPNLAPRSEIAAPFQERLSTFKRRSESDNRAS